MGDHSEIVAGGTPNTGHPEYWNPKEIPWMSSGEINNKVIYSTDNMISKIGFSNSSAKWVKEKSVLIALAGQGKTRGTVAISEIPLTTNQSIAAIQPDSFLYYKFLFQNLEERYNELREVSSGDGTRGGLNKQIISDLEVLAPEIQEQIKIGDFLCGIDTLITLHQRKYDKLTKVKKAMLEKMFPENGSPYPEIRFKGFTDAWEQREFGDENDLITGYPFESDCFSETGINLIRGMNVKRGYIDLSNDICVKWTSSKGLESYLLKENDIIIQMDGALIGKSYGIIKKKHLPALLVQRVTRARINNEIADSDFMYQTIQRDFLTYISMNKTETAVPHLSLNDIKNFGIMVPTLLEQKMIGSFFANLDRLITLHQRKLEKLKNIKKACLEKMFV